MFDREKVWCSSRTNPLYRDMLWPMVRGVFGELQVVCLGCMSFVVGNIRISSLLFALCSLLLVMFLYSHLATYCWSVPCLCYIIILQSPCESYIIYIYTHLSWWHVHVLAKTPMSLYYIPISSLNTCGWFSLQFSWSAFSFFWSILHVFCWNLWVCWFHLQVYPACLITFACLSIKTSVRIESDMS